MHKIAAILDKIDCGIIILDEKQKVSLWNSWIANKSSIGSDIATGKDLNQIFKVKIPARLMEKILLVAKTGQSCLLSDRFNKRSFPLYQDFVIKEVLDQKIKISRIKNSKGKNYCLIQVFDVSDTNRKENFLIKQSKMVEEKNIELERNSKMAALGQMASGVAHEINNPLAILLGASGALRRSMSMGNLDIDVNNKYITQIENSVIRMAKIVQGLKIISRDSSAEDFSSVKITTLMEDIFGVCSEKFRIDGITLIFDSNNPAYDKVIECRRVQISQVFINLLGNASDAIENLPEKWIKIECAFVKDDIEFRITDSGNGIPKDIQEKIFQPFYTTKPIGKGTGLGLSLSSSMVKDHGGVFYVDNKCPNTCFVLRLPIFQKIAA